MACACFSHMHANYFWSLRERLSKWNSVLDYKGCQRRQMTTLTNNKAADIDANACYHADYHCHGRLFETAFAGSQFWFDLHQPTGDTGHVVPFSVLAVY